MSPHDIAARVPAGSRRLQILSGASAVASATVSSRRIDGRRISRPEAAKTGALASPRSSSATPCYNPQSFLERMPTMRTAPITKPTVFIVDDDPGIRESISSLVRSVGFQPKLMASVDEFLQSGPLEGPSCLVLDVRLPGRSGLDLQRELADRRVLLPIVFITGHGDIPMSVQAMKGGAIEFLTKPFRDQDLLDAIQLGLTRDRARLDAESSMAEMRKRFDTLTVREREVMAGVVAGRLNKQIAGDLSISEITVKVHRGQVMRKMKASSVPDLARMADKLKLVGVDL